MKEEQTSDTSLSVAIKLQFFVFSIVLLIIVIPTWIYIRNARQQDKIESQKKLIALYNDYVEVVTLLEKNAATLSYSFANRPDIQERFYAKDRPGLRVLLEPVFSTLKMDYDIVHLQFHEPNGNVFLRVHDPDRYGDYTFTYRRANAVAIISRQTVAGIEIDPNRLGIQGVSPMFHKGQFIGLVEVGLNYDLAFLKTLKARTGADYTMWVTQKDAAPAGLGPVDSVPQSPSPEFFYYAGTNPTPLPIPVEVYHTVLHGAEPQIQFVSAGDEELAVLVAPMLGYGDRIIGILEISTSRAEALATLQRSQNTTLVVASGLALLALILIWISTRRVVLRPLGHLTAVAHRRLKGDLTARVELLPADEFGQLGHTFNVLTETLDDTLKDQEDTIAERTAQLQQELAERVRAEESLRASEAKYRELVQNANSIIFRMDTQGRVTFFNEFAQSFFGYDEDEIIGQNVVGTIVPERDSSGRDLVATIQDILQHPERYASHENENMRRNGERVWIAWTNKKVLGDNSHTAEILCIGNDITERMRLEGQLRQAQKMEAIGQLAAGIAHDFNNLLTAINGFATLMQLELATDDPAQELAAKILSSGQRAADLVRQLLAFSRKQLVRPQVLDLNTVVADMDKMLQRIIGEHIHMETVLAPDPWPVEVDPAQIEQVVVNLAVNARDAMPDGGKLTIETTNVVFDEEYIAHHPKAQPGQHVLLAISDTGIGMSQEVRDRIFEPFFTTKEVGKGTGLGLATVYGIVKQSGGDIGVYSNENSGTTFKIYLPRSEKATDPLAEQSRVGDLPRGNETVLLVEDAPSMRDLTARILRRQGYTVLEAADGEEALRLAREHSDGIHLLLTDVVMPGISGKDLADRLGAIAPSLKVLFMSGYTDNTIVRYGILDPDVAFLHKPFSPETLARNVRNVLDGRQ